MPLRIPVVASVLVLGVGLGVGLGAGLRVGLGVLASREVPGSTARPLLRSTAATDATPAREGPLAVLHAWDQRRAAAWAEGDAVALDRLYAPGSSARAADLRLLRHYTERGLVVRGLRMQVLRARVLVDRPRILVVEVTERLAPAHAARAAQPAASRALPAGRVTTHVVRFRKVGREWLVAAVSHADRRR